MTDLFGNTEPVKPRKEPKTPQQKLESNFKRVLYFVGCGENPLPETTPQAVRSFLGKTARFTKTCEACGVDLFFIVNVRSGKLMPFTSEAVCHFDDCPNAGRFRRTK